MVVSQTTKRCIIHDCLLWHQRQLTTLWTTSQRILMKGCTAGWVNFSCGTMKCDTDQSVAAVTLSCHYWWLNDPFAAYTAVETQNEFKWAGQLPKLPRHMGPSRPHLISNSWCRGPTWVSSQTASRLLQPFLHSTSE